MPARNAPSAIESPSAWVAHAPPSATNSTVSVKVSLLRCRAISWNSGRSAQRPSSSTTSSAMIARPTMPSSHCGPGISPAVAERRREREQRHECQVLEQQDADGEPRVRPVDLQLVAELAEDDRGRRHRERAADHDRHCGIQPERPRCPADRRRREQHLQPADAEHLGLHRDHARKRELESQREDEEHDADFRERGDRGRVGGEAQRVRTEQHPDQQVAQDRRAA